MHASVGAKQNNSVAWGLGPHHTMAEGREAINFNPTYCKKPRIQPLDPSHYSPKFKGHYSPKCLHGNIFLPRQRTLEGSLGHARMRLSVLFSYRNQEYRSLWLLDWMGCFG